jgi:hypothetical protein
MKITPQDIPKEMSKTIKLETKVTPREAEKDSISILKEIRDEEEKNKKGNKRATFFVNLIYVMSLALFGYMIYKGDIMYAVPALALTTLGAFIFNLFIFDESRKTKRRQDAVDQFYLEYELKKNN